MIQHNVPTTRTRGIRLQRRMSFKEEEGEMSFYSKEVEA